MRRTSPTPQRLPSLAERVAAVVGLVAMSLASCTSTSATRSAPPSASSAAVAAAAALLDRPRAPGEDNGLEVVRWSATDNEPGIRRALKRWALSDVSLGTSTAALERHGFRAVVVPEDRLPYLLADLGGTTRAIATWHGQALDWREISRVVSDQARIAIIDGRAERLAPGSLRLMVRAWTVPLEDGAVLEVQVAPQLLSESADFPALLNRDTLRGRLWPEATIRTELPRRTALVLVSAPARSDDREEDPEGPKGESERSGIGPLVELPQTLGELLLTDQEAVPPRRTVLVLWARLPDILFPTPVQGPATIGIPNAQPKPAATSSPRSDPDPEGPVDQALPTAVRPNS